MDSRTQIKFGTICNGEFEIHLLKQDDANEAIDVLRNSFFLNENICRATDVYLPESVEAKNELEKFGRILLKDGLSLAAKEISTNKIVAVAFNIIAFPSNHDEESPLENFSRTVQTPNMKCIMDWLDKMESKYDIFSNWNIDCVFELMFLATLPQFERKGLGRALAQHSIDLAKRLLKSDPNDIDIMRIFQENLYLCNKLQNRKPKAITSIFTSKFSQKIGQSLGFENLAEIPYTEFSYNGKTFADKIGPFHPTVTLSALKLY